MVGVSSYQPPVCNNLTKDSKCTVLSNSLTSSLSLFLSNKSSYFYWFFFLSYIFSNSIQSIWISQKLLSHLNSNAGEECF